MHYDFGRVFAPLTLILMFAAEAACQGSPFTSPALPTPTPSIEENGGNIVSAEGIVTPDRHAVVALKMSGRVTLVSVTEGNSVQAGDILVRVDNALLEKQVIHAETALNIANKQLDQLQKGATAAQRRAAQDALDSAQASYDKIKAGPTADELAQLKARLENTQAALSQAQFRYDRIGGDANPLGGAAPERLLLQQTWNSVVSAEAAWRDALNHPTESELKSALAAVSQAQSAVASLDPTPEAVALARAQVAQAQAALDVAKTSAEEAVLRAPFAGTVAQVNVQVGDFVPAGVPVVILGDLSKLCVETTDLSEVDVAKVQVGQGARVLLDAFPDRAFDGTVTRISPFAIESRGDKVFRVWIELREGTEVGLRWGMTANVEIAIGEWAARSE